MSHLPYYCSVLEAVTFVYLNDQTVLIVSDLLGTEVVHHCAAFFELVVTGILWGLSWQDCLICIDHGVFCLKVLFAVVAKNLLIGGHIQFHSRWRLVIKSTKTCHRLWILPGGRPPIRLIGLGSSQASRPLIPHLIKCLRKCLSLP